MGGGGGGWGWGGGNAGGGRGVEWGEGLGREWWRWHVKILGRGAGVG